MKIQRGGRRGFPHGSPVFMALTHLSQCGKHMFDSVVSHTLHLCMTEAFLFPVIISSLRAYVWVAVSELVLTSHEDGKLH